MLDFAPARSKQQSMSQLTAGLTISDLRRLTGEMVDTMLGILVDCTDTDVTFVPDDPEADDPYAADPADTDLAWTLGHVVVHVTASAEESAFLAAELARGVPSHGRSRYEVPWESVTTIAECRHRLEESRRMRLATLDVWPDEPHLNNLYEGYGGRSIGPVARFIYGLMHDDDHLEHLVDIVRQARAARQ